MQPKVKIENEGSTGEIFILQNPPQPDTSKGHATIQ